MIQGSMGNKQAKTTSDIFNVETIGKAITICIIVIVPVTTNATITTHVSLAVKRVTTTESGTSLCPPYPERLVEVKNVL